MGTKFPLETLSASWVATGSNGTGNNLTNKINLKPNSTYLLFVQMPLCEIGSTTYIPLRLSHNYNATKRYVHKNRGTVAWMVQTDNSTIPTGVQVVTNSTIIYSEISNAGFYAIKLDNRADPYLTIEKEGTSLPLLVKKATWTATSSKALNYKLTEEFTLKANHTYLLYVPLPTCSFNSTPNSFSFYNTDWGYENAVSLGMLMYIVSPKTDTTTYLQTGFSTSRTYSTIAYGGVYIIKLS